MSSDRYPKVSGRCPMGCGETLFLGEGGHVICSYLPCPNPSRISQLLDSFTNERHLIFVARESDLPWAPNTGAAPRIGVEIENSPFTGAEIRDEPR